MPRSDISGRRAGKQAGATARLEYAHEVAHACKRRTTIPSHPNHRIAAAHRGVAGLPRRSAAVRAACTVSGGAASPCGPAAVRGGGDAFAAPGGEKRAGVWARPAEVRVPGHECLARSVPGHRRGDRGRAAAARPSRQVEASRGNRPDRSGQDRPGRAEGNSPDAGEYPAFFNRSFSGRQSARASVQGPSCAIA
jgi:hypothetical protein